MEIFFSFFTKPSFYPLLSFHSRLFLRPPWFFLSFPPLYPPASLSISSVSFLRPFIRMTKSQTKPTCIESLHWPLPSSNFRCATIRPLHSPFPIVYHVLSFFHAVMGLILRVRATLVQLSKVTKEDYGVSDSLDLITRLCLLTESDACYSCISWISLPVLRLSRGGVSGDMWLVWGQESTINHTLFGLLLMTPLGTSGVTRNLCISDNHLFQIWVYDKPD